MTLSLAACTSVRGKMNAQIAQELALRCCKLKLSLMMLDTLQAGDTRACFMSGAVQADADAVSDNVSSLLNCRSAVQIMVKAYL